MNKVVVNIVAAAAGIAISKVLHDGSKLIVKAINNRTSNNIRTWDWDDKGKTVMTDDDSLDLPIVLN